MRIAVAAAFLALSFCARAQPLLTPEAQMRIIAHGPWAPAARHDSTNRVSGRREAIALGERLFFEPRLSGTGSVLCATCHVPPLYAEPGRPMHSADEIGIDDFQAQRSPDGMYRTIVQGQ